MAELNKERDISALPPMVRGGAIVVPGGLLQKASGEAPTVPELAEGHNRAETERLAMDAVMEAERSLGCEPRDVGAENLGYDVESRDPKKEMLRFIEVEGRVEGADTVTVTRNEILTALNKPEAFILAVVEVANGYAHQPRYVREPFQREPDFGATSVTYKLAKLLLRAEAPC